MHKGSIDAGEEDGPKDDDWEVLIQDDGSRESIQLTGMVGFHYLDICRGLVDIFTIALQISTYI